MRGFTLESLLKLGQTKSLDGKTTMLHYLAHIVTSKMPEIADFAEELPAAPAAARISWSLVAEEEGALRKGVAQVTAVARQLEEARLRSAEPAVDSAASVIQALRIGAAAAAVATAAGAGAESAVHASSKIGSFASSSRVEMDAVTSRGQEIKAKFAGLLEYFGQDAKLAPEQFFFTLNTFAEAFARARADNDAVAQRKAKQEAREKAAAASLQRRQSMPTQFRKPSGQ